MIHSGGFVRTAFEYARTTVVVLVALARVRRWLRREGLLGAMDRATAVRGAGALEARARPTAIERCLRDDQVVSWLLVHFRVKAICLYRSLAMALRISRAGWADTIELVIGVRRASHGVEAHAWLVVDGRPFRQDPAIWTEVEELSRVVGRPGQGVMRSGDLAGAPPHAPGPISAAAGAPGRLD